MGLLNSDNVKLTYKYNMRQSPATKTLSHFVQRVHERIQEIEKGMLELQVSPMIKVNRKQYWLMFVDIETLVKVKKPDSTTVALQTYTGKGLHVYYYGLFEIDSLAEHRQKLKENSCVSSVVDISTTLRVTPLRYLGCFSLKYNIWLHPYLLEHTDFDQMKKLSKISPSEYLKTKFAKQVCEYLHIKYKPDDLNTYADIMVKPLLSAKLKSNTDYLKTLTAMLACDKSI